MTKTDKLKVLAQQMTPLPWPITKRKMEGYTLNCGPNKIICHDSVTLEFVTLAVELALESIKEPAAIHVDTIPMPTF